jgi:Glycosyltransferase family 87
MPAFPANSRAGRPDPVLLGLAAAFVILAGVGLLPLPLRDFVEYWVAGDVFLHGGNAYDAEALSASLRVALGTERPAVTMMWNPPWTLPLTLPFAALPIRMAHAIWVAGQFGLVVVSVRLLSRVYGVPPPSTGYLRAAALLFPPTVFLIVYGQIGGVCLFGVAGFLYFADRHRPVPAGLCVALTAIKPHLLFAFGLYLVLQAVASRSTRVAVLAGAAAILASATTAWAINPHVYADYVVALNAPHGTSGYVTVREWRLPLGSYWLRMWTSPDRFAVQFLPAAVAATTTPLLWWKWRRTRAWPQVAPVLILLSLLAAPYGGWLFDLVLLLVPVCHAAGITGRSNGTRALNRMLTGVLVAELVILVALPGVAGLWLEHYVWFTPLVGLGYVLVLHRARPPEAGG